MQEALFTILFPVAGFVLGAYVSLDIIKMLVDLVYPEQEGEHDENC
ncbi:hypothetical protein SAMN02745227_01666 [Anaerobranca californiensis DSM 14826]|jgi:hypothetical protein|uniref:Uncharacterized protein n=1 Tax=Anaerobranca californiensis DSM 14826 TaxID=1120989 RepID=A0A1M6Q877_9FIRM|nr:hypothetical protein [Anaerobranca californiensis]SHK16494.1 hypothetical protein SAMN02745227_01666 [Anaerobranca californiensis DSM 14826]